jgi:hypothetical protein
MGKHMKFKSIALGSIMISLVAVTSVSLAQTGSSRYKLSLPSGGACDLTLMDCKNFDASSWAMVLIGESNPVFLQYITVMFNPREYSLARGASVITTDAAGKGASVLEIPQPESFTVTNTGEVTTGPIRTGRSLSRGSQSSGVSWITEDVSSFFSSNAGSMVMLPPAVSAGPVDPIGHIFCVVKTKTKSNQSNDRTSGASKGNSDASIAARLICLASLGQ